MLALHMEEKEFYPDTFIIRPNELDIPLCKKIQLLLQTTKNMV